MADRRMSWTRQMLMVQHWLPLGFKRKLDIQKLHEMKGELYVLDHKRVPQKILQHKANEGKQGLGVHLAPDGNEKAQYNIMMEKAKYWARKL